MNIIEKIICLLIFISLHAKASETSATDEMQLPFNFVKGNFLYKSIENKSELAELIEKHNQQLFAGENVPIIEDKDSLLDYQIKYRNKGSPYHLLEVRFPRTNELKAALIFVHLPAIKEHKSIQDLLNFYIANVHNQCKHKDRYILITDMIENAEYIAEWYNFGSEHCAKLQEMINKFT